MYADPSHIRDHVIKVRLNDAELGLLEALARFNQAQLAAFARDLILAQLQAEEERSAYDHGRDNRAPDRRGSGGA